MKKYSKLMAVLLVVAMLLPGIAQAAPVAEETLTVTRLKGIDRIGTAIEVSKEAYKEGAKTVVLAGRNGSADALTGTLLAASEKAPLLLSGKKELTKEVKAEIERLGAEKVIILGGTTAVSDDIEAEVEGLGLKVERVSGLNRFETAAAIAAKADKTTDAFLALGRGATAADGSEDALADALAVGPASGKTGRPVLLTEKGKLPEATIKAIKDLGVKNITIVGGTTAVTKDVVTALEALDVKVEDRVNGDTREETAIEVAKEYFADASMFIMANGRSDADALVGGYLGALKNAPVLLTSPKAANGLSAATKAYLEANKLTDAYVLGGTTVITEETLKAIEKALGKEEVEGELKVESVSAINLRQLEVKFNKEVEAGTGKNGSSNLANYYIGLANDTTGDVQLNSIKNLDNNTGSGAEEWEAKLQSDKKTVIIQSKTGLLLDSAVDASVTAGGLGLKQNERYYLQVRNIKDAKGNYGDAQEVNEVLTDTVKPTVKLKETIITDDTLELVYSEPITEATSEIYVDGDKVSVGDITDVPGNSTVADESVITIDISSLDKGNHKVAVVGTKDLNKNVLTPNPTTINFEKKDAADLTLTTPAVVSMKQVADNGFKVVFNTTNVYPVDDASGKVLTIKDGAYDTSGSKFVDLEIDDTEIYVEEILDEDGKAIHTEWYITVQAAKGLGIGDTTELVYDSANTMRKRIVLSKDAYFNDGNKDFNKDANEPAGKEKTVSVTFTKDVEAPVIKDVAKDISHAGVVISLTFTDGPFSTDVYNGEVALNGKNAVVKFVDKNGVTHEETVIPETTVRKDAIDGRSIVDLTITEGSMLNNAGDKLVEGNFEITLPNGFVIDVEETALTGGTNSTTTAKDYLLLEGTSPFVKRTVTYTVEDKENIVGVPATTKGLINSKLDIDAGTPTDVQTDLNGKVKDNQIAIVFDGDVDAKTAITKSNYKINNKALGAKDTVEVKKMDLSANYGNADALVVVITVAEETIEYTGNYDFYVSGVANRLGNKMLPVTDIIKLADNTAPVAEKITIENSKQIKVKFSETVEEVAGNDAFNNFKVTVNGMNLSVTDISGYDTNELTLTLADNFIEAGESLDVKATVVVKLDSNGDMFVTDTSGNKLATGTVTKK